MWHKIANIILRNRWFILLIILILTVFFGYFAFTGLRIDNKYGNMLPKDSPVQANFLQFKERFGEDGTTLLISIHSDSLYTEKLFSKWKELGDSILQIDGVVSVVSEATLFTVNNNIEKQTFEAKRIFSDTKFHEKSIDSIRKEVRINPVYRGLLYNEKENVSVMMVGLDENYLGDSKKLNFVIDLEEVAKSYEADFGKVHFSGLPHIRVLISKQIMAEMFIFIGLSIFATSLLTFLIFKSLRVVLICNFVISIAVIWALGSIALFNFNISVMMALIPPLMIVIGMPNCVFLMTKFHQELKAHGNKMKALIRVISKVGTATFITNFITSLGFITLIFTNSDRLVEFGFIASLNIMILFCLSICILPIISTFTKKPSNRHLKHLDRGFVIHFLNATVFLVVKKRKWVYAATVVILALSVWGMTRVITTGNIVGDLSKNHPISKDIRFMENEFGGSIPFEILVSYKAQNRLFQRSTLDKIDEVQSYIHADSLFSKSISMIDFIKVINMAYYGNNPERFEVFNNRDKIRLKTYIDNLDMTNMNSSFKMKELLDTTHKTLRIRAQVKDLGSYDMLDKAAQIRTDIDSILNPHKPEIERYFAKIDGGNKAYIDTLLTAYPEVYNALTSRLAKGNTDLQVAFDSDFDKIKTFYQKKDFNQQLREAIDYQYFDLTLTGTSVVAAEGTKYLIDSLLGGIIFAVFTVGILMAILFRSWGMIFVSLIPNLIPLIITGGIMGWLGIPLKPSTLLVFNISFGITADDSLHFLAKYRQELKSNKWDLVQCVINSIHGTGIGMFYTSIILFFGFSVFIFSEFGGTQALGILVSMTLLIAIATNLILVPTLLMSLQKRLLTKAFQEPFFEVYDEEADVDWGNLEINVEDTEGGKAIQ